MPQWRTASWLSAPPVFDAGSIDPAAAPIYPVRSPAHDAVGVSAFAPVTLCAFCAGSVASIRELRVDGELVIDMDELSHADYAGGITVLGERVLITVTPRVPFTPGALVRVSCIAENTAAEELSTLSWSFTVAPAVQYQGVQPSYGETLLLQPMTRFLTLEPLRAFLLAHALDDTADVPLQSRDGVAARVLYQLAYASELSSVLNPFMRADSSVLSTAIPARRSTLELATLLDSYEGAYMAAVGQLFDSGAYPREFRNNFADYFESLLYNYRVSAVCALVLLGRAIEAADTNV